MVEHSIPALLRFVHRWWALLLLGPLLGGVTAFAIFREVAPVYEAYTTLLVAPSNATTAGLTDVDTAQKLARTFAEAVRTRPVLEEAIGRVDPTLTVQDLERRVNARLVRDTQLLRISIEDTDPQRAALLANAVSEALVARTSTAQANRFSSSRENLARLVDQLRSDIDARTRQLDQLNAQPPSSDRDAAISRLQSELTQLQSTYSASLRSYEELRILEARDTGTLSIFEAAAVPLEPVRPKLIPTLTIGLLGGLVVALVFAGLAEYLDDGLQDRQRVARATGLTTIGVIPQADDDHRHTPPSRRLLEQYRLMLLNLQSMATHPIHSLMVTGGGIGEGKSLTARNLAIVLAETGQRVILVDADLHRPTQMKAFAISGRLGFSTLLLDPSLRVDAVVQPTGVPNLSLVPAGPTPADPTALFNSRRVEQRLIELAKRCDVLVFDTPPLLAQPDAALLSAHIDAVIFVVDAGRSRGRPTARAVEMLRDVGAELVGVVMNRVPRKSLEYADYGYAAYHREEPAGRQVSERSSVAAPLQEVG